MPVRTQEGGVPVARTGRLRHRLPSRTPPHSPGAGRSRLWCGTQLASAYPYVAGEFPVRYRLPLLLPV